jgi:hypothetical protein
MSDASDVCVALMLDGLNRAGSNGYDNITNNTVKIYSPPINGYYSGNDQYVQVIITSYVNTFFARIVGIKQTKNIVEATAYIRQGGDLADGAMIIAYDPNPNCSVSGTGGYSVSVSGSSTVNLNGGGIFLNSQAVCGFKIPNCADLNIYGGTLNSAGNNIDLVYCTFDPAITPQINQDSVAIPDVVYCPDLPPECKTMAPGATLLGSIMVPGNPQPVKEYLIYPGYYETFPQEALVTNKSHIYMASGVYCIDPKGPGDKTNLSWSPVAAATLNGSIESNPSKSNYNKYHAYNPNGRTSWGRARC